MKVKEGVGHFTFTPEEINNGIMEVFVKFVKEYNSVAKESRIDYMTYSDGYCEGVVFAINYDNVEPRRFTLLDWDEVVGREVVDEDNTIHYVFGDEEEDCRQAEEEEEDYEQAVEEILFYSKGE